MNKLIVLIAFLVSPIVAMESLELSKEPSALSKITEEDSRIFMKNFIRDVSAINRKVVEKTYSENHALCKSLLNLNKDLNSKQYNCSIKALLEHDSDLQKRVDAYRTVDSNIEIQRALKQVRDKQGDVEEAKKLVIQKRRELAELKLQEMYPMYSPLLMSEFDTRERENFIKRNVNYPTDENAMKDYKALFIYRTLQADKVE